MAATPNNNELLEAFMASQAEIMNRIEALQQSVSTLSSSKSSKSRRSRRSRSPEIIITEAAAEDITEAAAEDFTKAAGEDITGGLSISPDYRSPNNNRRSFTHNIKQQCWEKAEKIKGRDPERWRLDPHGNTVFRKLAGCPGCLCHDYDHIVPYSQGGMSTLENCQVLQATVNRSKGNKTDISKADLKQKSSYCRVSGTP